ncbi:MAG: outer membrane lipoprotein carrier protein LolA [Deltaproteobacteria bacterium]|nr:outer membrane lipoprotein carrier protein LolA [Deltaproteobacteria bacterium]
MALVSLVLFTGAKPAPKLKPAAATKSAATAKPVATAKPEVKAEASAGVAMDPEVRKIVDAMQAFYEKNQDFEAHFDQSYHYATFNRTQQSSGTVVFRKPRPNGNGELLAPAMRWDYDKPDPKSIVVTGGLVYMYQPEAQQLTKAPLNMQKLSASVTFLWGQGQLANEFYITRLADKPGVVLQLVPKKSDPRFDRIFMEVDPKTFQVIGTTVVDPDGSTNHMTFSNVKLDQNVPNERFVPKVPEGTQVIDMTKTPAQ